jgi:hypothetical protein
LVRRAVGNGARNRNLRESCCRHQVSYLMFVHKKTVPLTCSATQTCLHFFAAVPKPGSLRSRPGDGGWGRGGLPVGRGVALLRQPGTTAKPPNKHCEKTKKWHTARERTEPGFGICAKFAAEIKSRSREPGGG